MAAAKNPVDTTPKPRIIAGGPAAPQVKPTKPATPTTPTTVNGVPTSAQGIVNGFLAQYGLQSLGAWAWSRYTQLGGGSDALNQISLEMVDQPAFQQRFPAYRTLAAEGEAMSPAEMISYEQTAKQIMHNAGFPPGFMDSSDDLAKFMVNNVSTVELQARVQNAQSIALGNPEEINQLHTLYGLPDSVGALTAYFIDPTKAEPLLQQQFTAAQIGAQAVMTGVGQLSTAQATHLAQIGVTDATAASGFGKLGQEAGLFDNQVAGENKIDLNTQLAAQFDNSAAANLRILKRQQARVADFTGNAGENVGSGGVGGLGSVDKSA